MPSDTVSLIQAIKFVVIKFVVNAKNALIHLHNYRNKLKAPFSSRKFYSIQNSEYENFQCIIIFSFHFHKIRFILEFD